MDNNNIKSSFKQMLIDALNECPQYADKINAFSELFTEYDYKAIDERYRLHQYSDRSMPFNLEGNLTGCPQLSELVKQHPVAHHILKLMCERMSRDGTITMQLYKSKSKNSIEGNSLQELLKVHPKTIRNEIQILVKCGFIALYKQQSGHEPATYAINPAVAKKGNKGIDETAFWHLTTNSIQQTFLSMGKECTEHLIVSSEKDTAGFTHSTSRYSTKQKLEPFHTLDYDIKKSISKGALDTDSPKTDMQED